MSYEIDLQVGVKASPEEVYKALTEPKRLAQWWTSDIRGSGSKVGDVLEFWFGDFCQKFEVKTLKPGKHVHWKAKEGMDEWAPTEISFSLTTDDVQTLVRFRHSGWKKNTEFFAHCSMKWATFLLSFKDLLEKGKGKPAPNDLEIDHSK
ncbi:MAG: SRPBCC family protein [Dissulfurispiraceae bacterium]